MTTDRKIFDFLPRRGIMAEIEYPGVVQLIERVVWDHEAESLSLSTRTTFVALAAQTLQGRDALRRCFHFEQEREVHLYFKTLIV